MSASINLQTGDMAGDIIRTVRTIADLQYVFADEKARAALNPNQSVYRVEAHQPVGEGVEGGLFWGTSFVYPGTVGNEYFMTKGHFHSKRNRGEYYVTAQGKGALLLMGEDRDTRVEWMTPGSVHYIPGYTAHRVANIGHSVLSFLACWPSDAGHDYGTIAANGFSARLLCVNGEPKLVPQQ